MEDIKAFKYELQYLINSDEPVGQGGLIKAAQSHLKRSYSAGSDNKEKQPGRPEEERALIDFATANSLWVAEDALGAYLAEGAEQKVFFPVDKNCVFKLADAIFYVSWLDYFNNLLLHNRFFPNTSYTLTGFLRKGDKLLVVLNQPFIAISKATDLENVKSFLLTNGFLNKKDNDYYHPYLGIILEDLHDENVLTRDEALFFVDTVFFITTDFYNLP